MSARRKPLYRDRSGQALVELALVTPILLLLILGVVELSRAWNAHQILTNTAREALRSAVVDDPTYSQQTMYGRIDESLRLAALDPSLVEVSIEGWKSGTGTPARIQLRYPYQFTLLAPLFELSTGKRSVTLSTAFVMRNE
jgi:Flp pilus assembly protein TadG